MMDGKKVSLGRNIIAHVVGTKNTKYTNVKAVKVKKSSYNLKQGKTAGIKVSAVLVSPSKSNFPMIVQKSSIIRPIMKRWQRYQRKVKLRQCGKEPVPSMSMQGTDMQKNQGKVKK